MAQGHRRNDPEYAYIIGPSSDSGQFAKMNHRRGVVLRQIESQNWRHASR